ncbi:hypothetical protein HPB51_005118 [Rhipicephalus microplus]|uniref:Uncharacterized protein n=1 Tax=Rhipicephalus microplus TaxID=6941 RepID=A0A9J6EM02_RHIMP|nr:hypothetical protein HPB51_005118 [Rhipicephalus microplus]
MDLDPQGQEVSVFRAVVVPHHSEKAVRALVNEAAIKELLDSASRATAEYMRTVAAALCNPRHPVNVIIYPLTGAPLTETLDKGREKQRPVSCDQERSLAERRHSCEDVKNVLRFHSVDCTAQLRAVQPSRGPDAALMWYCKDLMESGTAIVYLHGRLARMGRRDERGAYCLPEKALRCADAAWGADGSGAGFLLMYADDIVLMADNKEDLQRLMDICGWALYYFNLDRVLEYAVHHVPELSAQLARIYFTRPTRLPHVVEISANVPHSHLHSIVEQMASGFLKTQIAQSWSLPRLKKGQKVAAIFGTGHVVTFDGVFLEFPSYPASYCMYLLAHDIGGRQFTLTTSANDLLIDFPEITLTISGLDGRVLINGSDALVHLPLVLKSG